MIKVIITSLLLLVSYSGIGQGLKASYYGQRFHNKVMANGAPYNMYAMTAAYNGVPLGTILRVCRVDDTNKCVRVKVTDRTAKRYSNRVDLSKKAFSELGPTSEGLIKINVYVEENKL